MKELIRSCRQRWEVSVRHVCVILPLNTPKVGRLISKMDFAPDSCLANNWCIWPSQDQVWMKRFGESTLEESSVLGFECCVGKKNAVETIFHWVDISVKLLLSFVSVNSEWTRWPNSRDCRKKSHSLTCVFKFWGRRTKKSNAFFMRKQLDVKNL